jgi:hypothetical protein
MSRVRHRQARYRRGAHLAPWQRWAIKSGSESTTAFATHEERMEAYDAVRNSLIEESDDLADDFDGFWKWEPDVPDELRRSIGIYDHILAPEPRQSEIVAERADLLERRRDWLHRRFR